MRDREARDVWKERGISGKLDRARKKGLLSEARRYLENKYNLPEGSLDTYNTSSQLEAVYMVLDGLRRTIEEKGIEFEGEKIFPIVKPYVNKIVKYIEKESGLYPISDPKIPMDYCLQGKDTIKALCEEFLSQAVSRVLEKHPIPKERPILPEDPKKIDEASSWFQAMYKNERD